MPNNSEVTETAREVMAPEHIPIMAVPTNRQALVGLSSKKKVAAIGIMSNNIDAGLETMFLLYVCYKHEQHIKIKIFYINSTYIDE